jgi:hypothetical protein
VEKENEAYHYKGLFYTRGTGCNVTEAQKING